jgi:hypothetical protein
MRFPVGSAGGNYRRRHFGDFVKDSDQGERDTLVLAFRAVDALFEHLGHCAMNSTSN